jgi:hypothetical protein
MRYVVGRPASVALAARGLLPGRVFDGLYFGALLRRIKADGSAGAGTPRRDVEAGAPVAG